MIAEFHFETKQIFNRATWEVSWYQPCTQAHQLSVN